MQFRGSYVALVTPMSSDGEVDQSALARLVRRHHQEGTDGIVIAGTTGEAATLDREEYGRVIGAAVDAAAGDIPIIAGVGAPATARVVELAREAKVNGAHALIGVTPYYLRTTQEGLFLHYRTLAEAVDLPLVLYNVPARTGVDLKPETVAALARLDSVQAIKEAVPGRQRVDELLEATAGRLPILSGDDGTSLEAMLAGGSGVVSVTANLAPRAMSELCRLGLAGDADAAQQLNQRLQELHGLLMAEPNPIPVKWALHFRGLIDSGIRLPLVTASRELQQRLERSMESVADLLLVADTQQ